MFNFPHYKQSLFVLGIAHHVVILHGHTLQHNARLLARAACSHVLHHQIPRTISMGSRSRSNTLVLPTIAATLLCYGVTTPLLTTAHKTVAAGLLIPVTLQLHPHKHTALPPTLLALLPAVCWFALGFALTAMLRATVGMGPGMGGGRVALDCMVALLRAS